MKKYILLILLLMHCVINSYAQGTGHGMFSEAKFKKQYYTGKNLAQEYALIGMYKQSLVENDKEPDSRVLINDSDTKIKAKNAYPYIYNAIKMNDIVIINECHDIPLHRSLLYVLTDSFNRLGVQGVFLETLGYTPDDSAFLVDHPNQHWGLYTFENIYNQAFRKMKRLHIKLYSYEKHYQKLDTATIENKKYIIRPGYINWLPIIADSFIIAQLYSADNFAKRDAEQALHIYEKLLKNKIKKAVIYCGYAHAFKSNRCMAGILQHLLNKKVYSIDQTLLNERSERKYENPLYTKYATSTYPFVLIDKKNQLLHTVAGDYYFLDSITKNSVDMVVGSPRTIYKNNRPTWLELIGDRKRYPLSKLVDVPSSASDFLVVIYDVGEYELTKLDATPLDVFQVEQDAAHYDAILTPHKKYHLFAYRDDKIIIDKIIDAQ